MYLILGLADDDDDDPWFSSPIENYNHNHSKKSYCPWSFGFVTELKGSSWCVWVPLLFVLDRKCMAKRARAFLRDVHGTTSGSMNRLIACLLLTLWVVPTFRRRTGNFLISKWIFGPFGHWIIFVTRQRHFLCQIVGCVMKISGKLFRFYKQQKWWNFSVKSHHDKIVASENGSKMRRSQMVLY